MQKIIINGANGFVASHFIRELLEQNFETIALVRKGKKRSAQQRMKKVLHEIDQDNSLNYNNLKIYNYSLNAKDHLLTKEEIDSLFNGRICFFHFAACLKYSTKDKDKIFETNVEGLKNSIQFFLKYAKPGSRFFFISTAYSCGKFTGVFQEKFYPNEDISHFRNYYEQSKRFAENVMKEYMESGRLNGHVVRLSQVVGDNKTGITKTGYGVFDFAKRLCKISALHPDNTLRLKVDPNGTQNLLSIDKVTDILMNMLNADDLSGVINLTEKNGVTNNIIAQCINKNLPVTIILDKTLKPKNMNSLERLIAAGMSFTGKYAGINLMFEHKNLDKIMFSANNEVTKRSLCKMMEYFIQELKNKNRNVKQLKSNK